MIDKRIGKRIKECREKPGMTQEDFSEKTKFSVNYISMQRTFRRRNGMPIGTAITVFLSRLTTQK